MRPIVTATEIAAADAAAIASGTPTHVLMERAGTAVAWVARRVLGGTYGRRVVVICGKGNNGGDGLIAASVLKGWGVKVEIHELKSELDRDSLQRDLDRCDLVIDAMYGTGLSVGLKDDAAFAAEILEAPGRLVLAVDIPSGVDATTGAVDGIAVQADVTVCFAALKTGLCCEPGRTLAGEVVIADIGIDASQSAGRSFVVEDDDLAMWLFPRLPDAHKWNVGSVLVIGGSIDMVGAPTLAACAALRSGAGMVVLATPAGAKSDGGFDELIVRRLGSAPDGSLGEGAAKEILDLANRFDAVVLGPGLGTSPTTSDVVNAIVANLETPLIIDADGINCLGGDFGPLSRRTAATIITPHAGEFARLSGHEVGTDRIAAARDLASRSGAVVVLKGPGTVVVEPGGRAAVNLSGGPWLATAGTGDVLAGITGAFLARMLRSHLPGGPGAFEAAVAAAHIHGLASEQCVHDGFIAGDLIAAIPSTLAGL